MLNYLVTFLKTVFTQNFLPLLIANMEIQLDLILLFPSVIIIILPHGCFEYSLMFDSKTLVMYKHL